MSQQIAPGARVEIRDAEWRVKRVDRTSDGGHSLRCEGLSELVRGKEGIFLTQLEKDIRVLRPEETELIVDDSPQYQATRLYLDTMLRQFIPNDQKMYVGQHAAMDQIPYQFDPARQALSQPRQRILIADSVGLGKTLSAGILTSELIARGRGKRILVLATKAMLLQFQQEFFNRFTIPLVRLDSVGLQRVRNNIPANHNPFHYYDRSIISIDTIKQDAQYRHHLENAYWDIIIIDEAHNVAERTKQSQRARLAKLLANRSDTLMMLSATPHDGKPESFASLMNMLDPTAIVDPSDYSNEDFRDKGLVIRRFKQDVAAQFSENFPERDIHTVKVPSSAAEDTLYRALMNAEFRTLDGRGSGQLFRTTLEKTLLSSPAALQSTLQNRRKRVEKNLARPGAEDDLAQIDKLMGVAEGVTPKEFTKFQRLVDMLTPGSEHSEDWNANNAVEDRMVVFTESVVTLKFLEKHLPKALKLKKDQVQILYGGMKDSEIADAVEAFNRRSAPVRLLLCSDVASEGINLHYFSHRLIHFDIPWSLMLFQQRNGRIDRYGQTQKPLIRYLTVETEVEKMRGDVRVLEILIEKDKQSQVNIGDPSEFVGTVEEQEDATAQVIESLATDAPFDLDAFLAQGNAQAADELDAFTPINQTTDRLSTLVGDLPRIFPSDDAYMRAALEWLTRENVVKDYSAENDLLRFSAPEDLRVRLSYLPKEAIPDHGQFALTADKDRIAKAMSYARDEGAGWSETQYLWPLHPAVEWAEDRSLNAFGRHSAPVIERSRDVPPNHVWVLLHGGYPNQRGQFILQAWRAVEFDGQGKRLRSLKIRDYLQEYPMDSLVNRGVAQDDASTDRLTALLPPAVQHMGEVLDALRRTFEEDSEMTAGKQLEELDALKARHLAALDARLERLVGKNREKAEREGKAHIESIFNDYWGWLENTQLPDKKPYIQIAAVIVGELS